MNHSLSTHRRLALMVTPIAAALMLVGCSSDGGAEAASGSSTSPTAASTMATESAKPKPGKASAPAAGYVSYSDYSKNQAKYDDSDVVLFFNASWCPTCAEADKQLSGAKFPDGLVVVSVDYDSNQDLRQEYGVTTQHTFVQVNPDGSEVSKFTGSTTVDQIQKQLA